MDAEVIDDDSVYENAAELFRAMAAPMRLRIISALCNGEKNVSEPAVVHRHHAARRDAAPEHALPPGILAAAAKA